MAGGSKQRDYISKEVTSSPTVATEAILLLCNINAEEGRDVTVINIPNALRGYGNHQDSWSPCGYPSPGCS